MVLFPTQLYMVERFQGAIDEIMQVGDARGRRPRQADLHCNRLTLKNTRSPGSMSWMSMLRVARQSIRTTASPPQSSSAVRWTPLLDKSFEKHKLDILGCKYTSGRKGSMISAMAKKYRRVKISI